MSSKEHELEKYLAATDGPPPVPPPHPYATKIPDRRQEWKTHSNIGFAKNAVLGCLGSEVWVYALHDEGWELLWHIPAGTPKEELPWVDGVALRRKTLQLQIESLERRLAFANAEVTRLENEIAHAENALELL